MYVSAASSSRGDVAAKSKYSILFRYLPTCHIKNFDLILRVCKERCQDMKPGGKNMEKCTQVLIIGSGVAALQLAKNLRPDVNVTILTKSNVLHGNSALAQGGVAAALAENDDPYKHFKDTI